MRTGGASCASKVIGLINLVVLVALAIGAWVAYSKKNKEDYYKLFTSCPAFKWLIAVIVFCAITSIIGFLLICIDNDVIQYIYLGLIVVTIVLEIACVAVAFKFTNEFKDFVSKQWKDNEELAIKFENAQHCCSFDNATVLPRCATSNYTNTCYDRVKALIKDNVKPVGVAVVIVLVLEIILLGCSFYLACCYHKDDNEVDITSY